MDRPRRKLKVLVITMGGERQEAMERMFASHDEDFEPPAFSPGIPSRWLRNRQNFLETCHEVGLLPQVEYTVLQANFDNPLYQRHPQKFFECLKDTPLPDATLRKGSQADLAVHYSVELWRKSKALNRGRSVIACMLAHLRAMKHSDGYDLIVEDNVRLRDGTTKAIWETLDAASKQEECQLLYFGWLGSLPNLKWVWNVHSKRQAAGDDDKLFYFPVAADFQDGDDEEEDDPNDSIVDYADNANGEVKNDGAKKNGPARAHTKPGGTAIWGAYAYTITREGYETLLNRLRNDVGSMLWKGKRMRAYLVKPIDKIMPRQVMQQSRHVSLVTTQPCFFRAPMLCSRIHTQWDAEFCKSTEYQLKTCLNLSWDDLWLTELEREIVNRYQTTGEWITMGKLLEMRAETSTVSDS